MLIGDTIVMLASAEANGSANWLQAAFHIAAQVVGATGVAVMLWGFLRSVFSLLRTEWLGNREQDRLNLRMGLGYYILLGLEFLIIADVIETLRAPDLNHIAMLGGIVVIRTVISISLNWELAHERKRHPPGDSPDSKDPS